MACSADTAYADTQFPQPVNTAGKRRLRGAPEPIAALNRVRIVELSLPFADREPLVDVREHCPNVHLSEHLCPFLRRTVSAMLNAAQDALPPGRQLQVGTCLRTLSMQKHGWDNYRSKLREQHPDWPLSTLRRSVNKYFAPYDQPAPPGHCTGAAVDVGLLGPDGEPLDMLGPTKGWEAAYTWSDKIGEEARANRMLMVEAMLNAGFSNCRDEYWHYSWGDSAWAVRTGSNECPYGWSHPPVTIDAQIGEGCAIVESVQTIRDLGGRPVRAEASVSTALRASDAKIDECKIRFRVNWGKDVPLTIRINGVLRQSASEPYVFYTNNGEDAWEPIGEAYIESDTRLLHIVPSHDRVVVSDFVSPPEPKSEEEAK